MPNAIIKLDNVSWAYSRGTEWALRDISLEIEEGSFIAVMGRNGAGKSSFCRLLNALIPHSLEGRMTGRVTIDGDDTRSSSVAQFAKKVGMAFEDPATQLFTASVYDEAAFALENLLLEPEEIAAKVRQALFLPAGKIGHGIIPVVPKAGRLQRPPYLRGDLLRFKQQIFKGKGCLVVNACCKKLRCRILKGHPDLFGKFGDA